VVESPLSFVNAAEAFMGSAAGSAAQLLRCGEKNFFLAVPQDPHAIPRPVFALPSGAADNTQLPVFEPV